MKWWHKIILFFTILIAVALGGAYLAMYISPEDFWPLAFLGLGYFPILIVYLFFCLIWFFMRKKVFAVLAIFFIVGLKSHLSYFSFGLTTNNKVEEGQQTYKILQYNVKGFDAYNKEGKYFNRDKILANIQKANADIVCLQEFNTYQNHPKEKSNLDLVLKATGLEHYFYYRAIQNTKGTRSFGLVILSKFPIVDTGHLEYLSLSKLNTTVFADLLIDSDTVRVFCSHLQSTQLSHYDFEMIEASNEAETDFDAERVTNKLKTSFALRAQEADTLAKAFANSPHPLISCGDFNDTPVSYTYRKLSANLDDAFLKEGIGIGATYAPFPFIRIDYQLFDEDQFDIISQYRIKEGSSDHYPCVTVFGMKE